MGRLAAQEDYDTIDPFYKQYLFAVSMGDALECGKLQIVHAIRTDGCTMWVLERAQVYGNNSVVIRCR